MTPTIDRKEFGMILMFGGALFLYLASCTGVYLIGVEDAGWQSFFAGVAAFMAVSSIVHLVFGTLLYRKE